MSFEDRRKRLVEGLDRFSHVLVRWLAAAAAWLDRVLRGLDREVVRVRDDALERAGLEPGDLTAGEVVERSPAWFRTPVQAVGRGLAAIGSRLGRVFTWVPADRHWRRAAAGLLLLLIAVIASSFRTPPEAQPLPGAWRPLVIGYFENGWDTRHPDSFPVVERYAESIDIIMPFWYSIHPDGSIEDRGTRTDVIDFAHNSGIQVVPLMNNAKTGMSAGFLVDPAARQEAASEIKALVDKYGYEGVHIDFELLPPEWKDDLTSFIAELRAVLGPDKHLSMAVFPQVDVSPDIAGVYDYAAVTGFCDFLVIMGYDHHYAGGPPGTVSPYDWIEKNLTYTRDQGISPSKIVLAVGLYGYDWPTSGQATDVPLRWVGDLARRYGVTPQWDTASQNPYLIYYEGRNRHEVWYQDERTVAQRIEQARQYKLRGLAFWRLGYETAETWNVVRSELGAKRTGGR